MHAREARSKTGWSQPGLACAIIGSMSNAPIDIRTEPHGDCGWFLVIRNGTLIADVHGREVARTLVNTLVNAELRRAGLLVGDPAHELAPLAVRLAMGRAKYPRGATVLSLLDEAGEVAHAVNKYETSERIREELLDVAVVAMRLYLGEIDTELQVEGLFQRRR